MTVAIELRGITKRFPGVVANDNITLKVEHGSIHAIIGENGCGKSTLMNILFGMLAPDEGEILLDGVPIAFKSPRAAIEAGIGMVHQHFMLADNLTVAENIILGAEPARVISPHKVAPSLRAIAERYGLDVDPEAMTSDLGVGARQRVEILKVLYREARILILDEPTAVLVPHEVTELFESLASLKDLGHTIIFISHKLDEVLANADEITVIRSGKVVATDIAPADVTASGLAELMVGSELPSPAGRTTVPQDSIRLEVAGLTAAGEDPSRPVISDIDVAIRAGEIVGIAGVAGNGQSELIEAIIGTRPLTSGTITLNGERIDGLSTKDRRDAGLGYIPEDRHRSGLLLDAPLWENAMLGHQRSAPFVRGHLIDRTGARNRTNEIISGFDVRTPSDLVPAHALSGGNQQKLIIGRELTAEPIALIAAHPTRGIDVGAQAAVWDQLRAARDAGLGVLLISADLEELIGLSDSLRVMLRGRLTASLDPETITSQELGLHLTGSGVAH